MKQQITKEELKNRLSTVLMRHIGKSKAVSMGMLYREVYGEDPKNQVNDTRRLREAVTTLRREGIPVCSSAAAGFWLASAGSELERYCAALRRSALRKLKMESELRKTSLPALLGEIQLGIAPHMKGAENGGK